MTATNEQTATRKRRPKTTGAKPRVPKAQIGLGAGAIALAGTAAFNRSRAKRAEQANPPRGDAIQVDGVTLHYVDSRTPGPIIVLLHGNGTTLEDWLACGLFQQLSESNRVIAFDRPGFGYSTRPRSRLWSPASQADLLALALKSLGAGNVTVVGHSFGTMVSIELARRHPDLIHSLVLLSGYYYPSVRLDALVGSIPAIPILGDVERHTIAPLFGAALRPVVERKLFAPAVVASSWRKFPFEMTLRPSQLRAEAAEAALMVPAAAEMAPHYAELAVPVHIISGEGDRIVDHKSQSARLAAELLVAKLTTLYGAGHMVHHTAADRVLHAIRQGLREQATIEA